MSPSSRVGIIFDLDGTLVDSIPAYKEEFGDLASRFGRGIGPEHFDKVQGRPIPEVLRILVAEGKLARRVWLYLLINGGRIRRRIDSRLRLFPQTLDCLRRLEEYPLALATSGSRAHVKKTLRRFGLMSYFSVVVAREDTRRGKPAPDAFELAGTRLGIVPDQCLVIEDSPLGVQAARAAGMYSIGVLQTSPRELFAGDGWPDHLVPSLDGITSALVEQLVNGDIERRSGSCGS